MPIVTKPATVEKNVVAQFTLDKSVLASVASVVADSYFSDMLNWSEVLIYYKSSEGNQREILKFDAIMASPTANFLVSEFARDVFEVQKIVIKDFDNGSFVVQRSELTVAEFDVDMSGGGSGGGVSLTLIATSEDGTLLSVSPQGFGDAVVNSSSYNGYFYGFFYFYAPTGSIALDGNTLVRHRIYLSNLTSSVGSDFVFEMEGFGPGVTLSGVDALSQYSANGYVEIDYISNSGSYIYFQSKAQTQGSVSYTVSKIEIYEI